MCISIEYEIRDSVVRWNMESLSREVWPRCPPPRLIRPREEEGKEVLIPERRGREVRRVALLRSGLTLAGGFGLKVRRVLFAQTRDLLKSGQLSQKEVAGAAAQLNSFLYGLIVEELKLEKSDAVRISIEYEIEGDSISWRLDTLKVEAWKKMADEHVAEKVERTRSRGLVSEE